MIIGGGLTGCETALWLARQGKDVTIVEMLDSVARDMFFINRMHLLKLLADANVRILTDAKVTEITEDGVVIANKDNKRSTLQADAVVLALGFKPDDRLLAALQGKVPELYAIGDCVEPRKAVNAIREGFRAARLI